MRYLTAVIAAALLTAPALADGPVRRVIRKLQPAPKMAPVVVSQGAAPVAAPPAAAFAPFKAKLLAEAADLMAKHKAGKLSPEQWQRLLAILELILKFAPLFFEPPAS